jgi:hypothetical protein
MAQEFFVNVVYFSVKELRFRPLISFTKVLD